MERSPPGGHERGRTLTLLGVVLLGALLAGCEPKPTGPNPPELCTLPQTPVPAAAVANLSREPLQAAVVDAQQRMTAALPAGSATAELRGALGQLAQSLDAGNREAGCRALNAAFDALDRQANESATLPDRAALRLVLDLTAAALR
jgi:hypothetical protein